MIQAYRPLFRTGRARRLVAASLLARITLGGMFDLPLILLAQEATGSYAAAGSALAAHAGGIAVSAPLRGRLVDRLGARAALPPFVAVTALATGALPFAAEANAAWPIVLLAGIAGVTVPSLAAAMRLEWQRLLGPSDARLTQAYAFEASATVGLYILGPLLAGLGVAAVGAGATIGSVAAVGLLAGMAFAVQAGARPRALAPTKATPSSVRAAGLWVLVLSTLLADAGLGAVDVAVPAFAREHGAEGAAGLLLALFAGSSVLGGVIYGARPAPVRHAPRMALLTGLGGVAMLPLALADSLVMLGALLVVAGLPFTAQWAARSLALDGVTSGDRAAETYNWLSSANAAGVALGALLAGVAIELAGVPAAFLAGALATGSAAAVLLVARRSLG